MTNSSRAAADPHDLQRFLDAQAQSYAAALAEVRRGRKTSHWMWYVFPQYQGLGFSEMTKRYSIKSRAEAAAYLQQPILGPRLIEICQAALDVQGRSAHDVFGSPDDAKLQSCATLFALVSPPGSVFEKLLDKYYQGQRDSKTVQLLSE